jgi:hypothetical protein
MPAERVAMRQVREIIHLKFSACVPTREIARRLGIAASTVRETLRRLESTGLNWPLPDDMTDGNLESKQGHRRHAEPDWPTVHRELKRKHVTLLIVWDEYTAENLGGYSYSRYCELYRAFESRLPDTMRQTHAAGERLFVDYAVDYAGDGVPVVVDRLTGVPEGLHMGIDPIDERLRPGRSRIGKARRAEHGDEDLRLADSDQWRAAPSGAGQHQGRGRQGLSL